jgi:hypothetical protein
MILVTGLAAVAAFATAGGAGASVSALDLGGDPEGYVVLSKKNKLAERGPRVAFLANIACTAGQSAGILVVAKQPGTGATSQGAGGTGDDCNGGGQLALVLMEKIPGSPQFRFQGPLSTEGFGVTDLGTGQVNDLRFDQSTLNPFDPSSLPAAP